MGAMECEVHDECQLLIDPLVVCLKDRSEEGRNGAGSIAIPRRGSLSCLGAQ
jgi:hypothetical protein